MVAGDGAWYSGGQDCPDLRVPVIHIGTCETERNDLASVVADQMQFETMAPSHRPFPISSQTFEYLEIKERPLIFRKTINNEIPKQNHLALGFFA